jgi:hypothetical protein
VSPQEHSKNGRKPSLVSEEPYVQPRGAGYSPNSLIRAFVDVRDARKHLNPTSEHENIMNRPHIIDSAGLLGLLQLLKARSKIFWFRMFSKNYPYLGQFFMDLDETMLDSSGYQDERFCNPSITSKFNPWPPVG